MTRRALLLAALAAAITPIRAATAAPTSGSTTAPTGTWHRLPGTSIEIHATDSTGRATTVPVTWVGDKVTATFAAALTTTPGTVTMAGYGLTARWAGVR